jgi:hypothetical protein
MLLSARVASIAGPFLWTGTLLALEPHFGTGVAYRGAVITVSLMFLASLWILHGVPDRREAPLAAE